MYLLLRCALFALVLRESYQGHHSAIQHEIDHQEFGSTKNAYCIEKCPRGFEYIPGLQHCYRLLLDLGPTSHDRGVIACGMASSILVTLDKRGDEDTIRTYFWDKYNDTMMAHPNYFETAGFWTAYNRMSEYGTLPVCELADSDCREQEGALFANVYTLEQMNQKFWRFNQPNNERWNQGCAARKWFYAEWLSDKKKKSKQGLDDYVCAAPHWIVCQVRKDFALAKRGWNVKLQIELENGMNPDPQQPCEENWPEQSDLGFDVLVAEATANGNHKVVDDYEAARGNIQSPSYAIVNTF